MENMKTNKDSSTQERILSLMEEGGDTDEQELESILKDPDAAQDFEDLQRLAGAVRAESASAPDADMEWERFSRRISNRRASRRRDFWLGWSSGIAAAFVIAVMALWFFPGRDDSHLYLASVSDDDVSQVTLETSEGESIVLAKDRTTALNNLAGIISQTDTTTITYAMTDGGEDVRTHTLRTPHGQAFKVVLSDGTAVWLNAESRLEYPSRFTGAERCVKLTGEAYFDVAPDKEHPFIVETSKIRTRVLGTEFNICSYPQVPQHVTLVKGRVEVQDSRRSKPVVLSPGEDATLERNGSFSVKEVDTDVYEYWKDGYFYFDDAPLSAIMQKIGLWFNSDVRFDNRDAMKYHIHFFCDRTSTIEEVIGQLNMLDKIAVSNENGVIVVK